MAKAGDFFLVQIRDESLILTRDTKGVVHALSNSCRPRGSRVCNEPSANARSLVCPCQWVFALIPIGLWRVWGLLQKISTNGKFMTVASLEFTHGVALQILRQ